MPREVHRNDVQELVASGAQLVEVLPQQDFEEQHLPGAIHLPLRKIEREAGQMLDRSRAVLVYCWDSA